jgi:DUF4097 and DUF4098 domain-containing protein YvlB
MKMAFVLLIAGFLPWAACAQTYSDQSPFQTKSLAKESFKKAEVETSGGNITVTGVPAAEAKIEVFVSPNNDRNENLSRDEIQKRLDEFYDLSISVANDKLTAIAKPKVHSMNWRRGVSVSFKLYIPQEVSTDLNTSGGDIRLSNLSGGTQDFNTSGGNLDLDHLSGKITGRTSGGNIDLRNSKEDIDLSTSGGDVKAINCQGRIKLVTSGGSVNGNKIEGELSAHTSGGDVRLDGLSCSLETSTSGGNIDVSMATLGKYVRINNSGGDIDLQVPKNLGLDLRLSGDKVRVEELNNFSGRKDENEINGKMNGGGIPITVDGGSGRVSLTFK